MEKEELKQEETPKKEEKAKKKINKKQEELEKALTETIIKVKEHSYNVQIDEMDKNDLIAWQKILQQKSKLQKLHISL